MEEYLLNMLHVECYLDQWVGANFEEVILEDGYGCKIEMVKFSWN
jgi:hypothetical protein